MKLIDSEQAGSTEFTLSVRSSTQEFMHYDKHYAPSGQ